ncbi:acyl-CoA thioesterase [Actinomadura harenae]|uniref:Thioesterase family protein n=1 Tax=Actinomadura harenae TaxID=2483351 RepID=A0A3M2M0H5_9ACTN|nr:thioesterase family protein [Actinomadura harenae]RMI41875.1 thioesterase family protein [Actinomadura harenae]
MTSNAAPGRSAGHPFDAAVRLTQVGEGRFGGHTSAEYANMVGPFGGVTAATLLRAVQVDPRCAGDPVALTVNYAGPLAQGPFTVEAEPVRTNRRTQHWALTMLQDDVVAATATAIVGARPETWADTEAVPPSAPSADEVKIADLAGLVPWTDNYEFRFVDGAPDLGTGPHPTSATTLWVRDHPARPLDHPALVALSDVFIPRIMMRRGEYVPSGTVTLTVYFHAGPDLIAAQADRPILATAGSDRLGLGFADQSVRLWTPEGGLLATSHQMVYFK